MVPFASSVPLQPVRAKRTQRHRQKTKPRSDPEKRQRHALSLARFSPLRARLFSEGTTRSELQPFAGTAKR
jgi:hypothetical protein